MPKITFEGRTIECEVGENLLNVLIRAGSCIYNGKSKFLNCKGLGTCGTCSVKVSGGLSKMTEREKLRLSLPPHKLDSGFRLACQCKVTGDVELTKHKGFWGQQEE